MRIWSLHDRSSSILRDYEVFFPITAEFSPDGKHVVASDFDGVLRLWNVRTSKLFRKWKAHRDAVWNVAFTPNGRGLVTGSHDKTIKYWDLSPPAYGDLREVGGFKINLFELVLKPAERRSFRCYFTRWLMDLVHLTTLHIFGI